MKNVVHIPEGVSVVIDRKRVSVSGPKGSVERNFDDPRFNDFVSMRVADSTFVVDTEGDKKKLGALAGTICASVRNMVRGVTDEYRYILKIVYTHFPMNITVSGDKVEIRNFLGEKGARTAKIIGKSKVHIDKEHIEVSGVDINEVGQTAANIERACRLRSRDRRIFQDGIYITEKHFGKHRIK